MDEPEKILHLLQVLAEQGIKFKVDTDDTVYLIGLSEREIALLEAILESEPDEHGLEEAGYRLWWD